MQSHRFSKDRRVRRRSEFQHAFSTGTRVHGKFLTLLMAPNRAGTTRLGLVASRKLGNSAERNRAKRLLREIFRQTVSSADGAGADIIVIPRRELLDASYSTLEQDFRTAFRRCASRLSGHAR